MASHFFLLLSSLIATIAIISVLYSFNIAVLPTTPLVASQLEKSPSFWTTGADMPTPRTDFTGAALNGSITSLEDLIAKAQQKIPQNFIIQKQTNGILPLHYQML